MQTVINQPSKEEEKQFQAKYPKFYEAVFSDSDTFANQMQMASLYLMAFECLRKFLESQFEGFFCHKWKRNKLNQLIVERGPEFQKIYQEYKKGSKEAKWFDVACNWFHEAGALDDESMESLKALKELRNAIAHDLFSVLVNEEYPLIGKDITYSAIGFCHQIANWWIKNVEASIAPEDYEQYPEEAMDQATTLQVQLLMLLADKISGPENTA